MKACKGGCLSWLPKKSCAWPWKKAFDYRGDVTVTLKDNSKIEGYLFDRTTGPSLSTSFVRILPADSHQKVKIAYSDIAALAFHRQGHSCRKELGGLGWQVLGKEGFW